MGVGERWELWLWREVGMDEGLCVSRTAPLQVKGVKGDT